MSRRRSTGDLVPRDITDILARETRTQRGQRKQGSSLGQAFSWLRGSRRKKNGLNKASVADAKLVLQNHESGKAGPKGNEDQKRLTVRYTTSQHYQENVFIEGSRPQYLEDLHTEAQEGLKILQQEEHQSKNGVNFPDDESIASTDTLRPEQHIGSKDGGGSPEPRSTIENSGTTLTSAVSTRPVLACQGSTFKPLNPVKKFDKNRKKNRRTTIMGIPNQVQKELALHRSSTFQPLVSTQASNEDEQVNDQSDIVIIPTVDGGTPVANKEGARVHLSELEISSDQQNFQVAYQDETPFNYKSFRSHLCPTPTLRPKSVAVPGMTTSPSFSSLTVLGFLQEPQGPVMSISPQATYLSTIIPNAVLPASVDVIEIDRSSIRTHGSSVRTVSKSSLASGDSSVSPLLSRKSDGSQTPHSNDDATPMATLALETNWSESQPSGIIISNSSPISSKGSTHSVNSQKPGTNGDQDRLSLNSSVSWINSPSSKSENVVTEPESQSVVSGSDTADEEAKNKRNSCRSLSVMKTKQPPAPPRRTNSLHNNKIRSERRVLVDIEDLNDFLSGGVASATENNAENDKIKLASVPNPVMNTAGSTYASSSTLGPVQTSSDEAQGATEPQPELSTSSPLKTPSEGGKFERTMSPSSGYSSQSGTPTLSPKGISPTSPDKQRKKPVKPERSVSRPSSSAASPSSSLTSLSSGTSEPINADVSTRSLSLTLQESTPVVAENPANNTSSTLRAELRELLNIPPPPKVKAPCPPPPETWVHNRRTFELLCGSFSNVSKVTQTPAQHSDSTVKQRGTQTDVIKAITLELSETKVTAGTFLSTDPESVHLELEGRECTGMKKEEVKASADAERREQSSSPVLKDPVSQVQIPKKEPPPVMKKPTTVVHRQEPVSIEHSADRQQMETSTMTGVNLPVENNKATTQNGVIVLIDNSKNEMDKSEVTLLSVEVPKISKVSPPPTPPPAYHPTPPPSRRTPPSSVSMPIDILQRVQEEIHVVESCWPPPPPPLEGDSVFDGGDEVDFPPPPPPFVADNVLGVTETCMTKLDVPETQTEEDGQTVEASLHGQIPDLTYAVLQAVETDDKKELVMQILKADTDTDISYSPLSMDHVPPPQVELLPLPPTTRAKNPIAVSTLPPSSSFLKLDSVKTEDWSSSELPISAQLRTLITVPLAPPLPAENLTHGVNFRRQPSLANRDTRSKELLSRHKSAPIPKEDANIPLVTPSLLQMVRLRSVSMAEDQETPPSEDKPTNEEGPDQENCPVSIPDPQYIPQKPIRKSLSLKSPPQTVKTSPVTISSPSMRLQEAIRMKTAAMSCRDGLPSRLGVRSQTYSCAGEPGALMLKSHEGCDMHKSLASTASFIFSKSTKKVVVEATTASSPEAQASLKQSLAAELMQVTDQSRAAAFNSGMNGDKVPPPVAKKPAHGSISNSQNHPACSGKMEFGIDGNGVKHMSGLTPSETTTTRVTADTIETLF